MSDKEWLLALLSDKKSRTEREIRQLSRLQRGVELTVHSRVAELRRDGWDIECMSIPHMKASIYTLIGKREERVRVREEPAVKGYMFMSQDDDNRRNQTICRIIRRAEVSDTEAAEFGAAFLVEFGDGHRDVCYGEELRPWYPV